MKLFKYILVIFSTLFAPLLYDNGAAFAQQKSEKAIFVGVGYTNIYDTYLSPLEYTGVELRVLAEKDKATASGFHHNFQHEAYISTTKNNRKTASEIAGMYSFSYALLHDVNLLKVENLSLRAGGHATLNAGFLYNTRNENNPAQGRLGLQVGPSVMGKYDFKIGRRQMAVNYEASAPLVGLMFSPNYGQSYYEIFTRGNYDSNCVPTTIVSTPSFRHVLTVDFKLGKRTLSVGYLGDYNQYKVNSLKYHNYTHSILVGVRY